MARIKTLILIICTMMALGVSAQDSSTELSLVEIITQNADQIQQVAQFGYGRINDMTWTPDGERVVVAGVYGLIFYDADLFEYAPAERWTLPEETVFSVAYSPDGSMLATLSGNRVPVDDDEQWVYRLWDVNTGTIITEWSRPDGFRSQLIFSPDGNELSIAHNWDENGVAHWDISDPNNIVELEPETWTAIQRRWYAPDSVDLPIQYALAYSPDGSNAAYPGASGIELVNTTNGALLFTLLSDEIYGVSELIYSPNSRLLIGLAYSEMGAGAIQIWDTRNGNLVFESSNGSISAFGLHPTQSAIVFKQSIYDTAVHRWQIDMRTSERVLGQQTNSWHNQFTSIDFSTNSRILVAIHGGAVEFWDVYQGIKIRDDIYIERVPSLDGFIYTHVQFSPDGRWLALVERQQIDSSAGNIISILDAQSLEVLGQIRYDNSMSGLSFNPDGALLATYHYLQDGTNVAHLWRIDRISPAETLTEMDASIWHLNQGGFYGNSAFSPDGSVLAIAGRGIELWDVSAVMEVGEVGNFDDYDNSAQITTLEGNNFGITAFSPDGSLIVAPGNTSGCYLDVRAVQTGVLVACLGETSIDQPQAVMFITDSLLISGAEDRFSNADTVNNLLLWDIESESLITQLEGHFENYNAIAVSPDRRLIVSAGGGIGVCSECPSQDGALRIWGIPAGE